MPPPSASPIKTNIRHPVLQSALTICKLEDEESVVQTLLEHFCANEEDPWAVPRSLLVARTLAAFGKRKPSSSNATTASGVATAASKVVAVAPPKTMTTTASSSSSSSPNTNLNPHAPKGPRRLHLSAAVARDLHHLAHDLVQVRQTLVSNSSNDNNNTAWSVASLAASTRQLWESSPGFRECVLLRSTTTKSTMPEEDRHKFAIYAVRVWMALQDQAQTVVRRARAFAALWDGLHNNNNNNNNANAVLSALWKGCVLAPVVPGDTAGAATVATASSLANATATTIERLQVAAWELSHVVGAVILQQQQKHANQSTPPKTPANNDHDENQNNKRRRDEWAALCAGLGLCLSMPVLAGLQIPGLVLHQSRRGGEETVGAAAASPPPNKKARTGNQKDDEDVYVWDILLRTANASLPPTTPCTGAHIFDPMEQVSVLLKRILLTQHDRFTPRTPMPVAGPAPPATADALWKRLHRTVERPAGLAYHMSNIAASAYESICGSAAEEHVRVEDVPYVNASLLGSPLRLSESMINAFWREEAPPSEEESDQKKDGNENNNMFTDDSNHDGGGDDTDVLERTDLTPAVLTDAMEWNEWAVSLVSWDPIQPSPLLRKCLAGALEQLVVPLVNKVLQRLEQHQRKKTQSPRRTQPSVLSLNSEGVLQTNCSNASNNDGRIDSRLPVGRALVALYYESLEATLVEELARLETEDLELVGNASYHKSLLALTLSAVVFGIGFSHRVQPSERDNDQTAASSLELFTVLRLTSANPVDYLKASEFFLRSLQNPILNGKYPSPHPLRLPRRVVDHVEQCESLILDSILWARDPKVEETFPDILEDFMEKDSAVDKMRYWPPPCLDLLLEDERLCTKSTPPASLPYPTAQQEDFADFQGVNYIFQKVLRLAYDRLRHLCKYLRIPTQSPFMFQTWLTFRHLLREEVDILFDRHIDHFILCCIYSTQRVMSFPADLTFVKIIDAYVAVRGKEIGDVTCQRILRNALLPADFQDCVGNVIELYNAVFVPTLKKYMENNNVVAVHTKETAQLIKIAEKANAVSVIVRPPENSAIITLGSANTTLVHLANVLSSRPQAR